MFSLYIEELMSARCIQSMRLTEGTVRPILIRNQFCWVTLHCKFPIIYVLVTIALLWCFAWNPWFMKARTCSKLKSNLVLMQVTLYLSTSRSCMCMMVLLNFHLGGMKKCTPFLYTNICLNLVQHSWSSPHASGVKCHIPAYSWRCFRLHVSFLTFDLTLATKD